MPPTSDSTQWINICYHKLLNTTTNNINVLVNVQCPKHISWSIHHSHAETIERARLHAIHNLYLICIVFMS